MTTYITWTPEEWASLAKRAAALKATRPDMAWTQIVPVCQDDIAPERRRFSINKLSGLKPMFDILDLDDQGNPKPPPPPPPPAPEEPKPEIVTTTPPFQAAPVNLKDAPIEALFAEVFARASFLKEQMDGLLGTKAAIMELLEANKVKMDTFLKRLDEVEGYALQNMEGMDRINLTYVTNMETQKKLIEMIRKSGLEWVDAPTMMEALDDVDAKVEKTPRMAPKRILIVGLLQKELSRIKERLPRQLNVELIHGENSEQVVLPANIQFALVSGHNDCTRRWQTVHAHYGDKAHRMSNGSIGSFVHAIEELCALGR